MPTGSTTVRVKAYKDEAPHHGFDRAFAQALDQLSTKIGTGKYAVRVEFGAEVEVENPGHVGFFKVTLTSP